MEKKLSTPPDNTVNLPLPRLAISSQHLTKPLIPIYIYTQEAFVKFVSWTSLKPIKIPHCPDDLIIYTSINTFPSAKLVWIPIYPTFIGTLPFGKYPLISRNVKQLRSENDTGNEGPSLFSKSILSKDENELPSSKYPIFRKHWTVKTVLANHSIPF